jgi:hypothetical protein
VHLTALQPSGTGPPPGGKGSKGILTQAATGEEELIDAWAAELAHLATQVKR